MSSNQRAGSPPADLKAAPGPGDARASDGAGGHGSARVVLWALAINFVIAIFKFAVAILSGSAAMQAEAFHSLADTCNQVFLLLGLRLAARPADDDHPFGYGGERYFWAFMAALGIFSIGGSLSIYEGAHKLFFEEHPPLERPLWAFIVLGGSIVLETVSLVVAVREFRQSTRGKGFRSTLREARDPTVLTVLFEDAAALVGLVFAFAGVLLAWVTGDARWDGGASILVGGVLIAVAALLAVDAKALLIGKSVPESQRRRIAEIASAARDVIGVVHIRTVHIGPTEVMCGLKLRFTPTLDTRTLEVRINELEASLRSELPILRRIYVEPGFDEHAPGGAGR